jgi:hypothetical protein
VQDRQSDAGALDASHGARVEHPAAEMEAFDCGDCDDHTLARVYDRHMIHPEHLGSRGVACGPRKPLLRRRREHLGHRGPPRWWVRLFGRGLALMMRVCHICELLPRHWVDKRVVGLMASSKGGTAVVHMLVRIRPGNNHLAAEMTHSTPRSIHMRGYRKQEQKEQLRNQIPAVSLRKNVALGAEADCWGNTPCQGQSKEDLGVGPLRIRMEWRIT